MRPGTSLGRRGVTALAAVALGAFLVAGALMAHFVVAGQVRKFPLSVHLVSALQGGKASYFSFSQLREVAGVTLRATSTTTGDAAAGTGSIAVWDQTLSLQDLTHGLMYQYSTWEMAFDRRTGRLINCCGAAVGNDTRVRMSGQGVVWPSGTQRRTYLVFNTTVLKAVPARYAGTATIGGLTTYKFTENVPSTRFADQSVPGSLAGLDSQPSVTLGEYYQATITTWVDPASGLPVKQRQDERISLDTAAGAPVLNVLRADLVSQPATVRSAVALARSDHTRAQWVSLTGPVVAAPAGVVLLVLGAVTAAGSRAGRRGRGRGRRGDDGDAESGELGGPQAGRADCADMTAGLPEEPGRSGQPGAPGLAVPAPPVRHFLRRDTGRKAASRDASRAPGHVGARHDDP
jgi:hypothetical protein